MKRVWSVLGWMMLVLVVVIGAAIAVLWLALPLDGTTISIDGESFSLANLSGGELALAFVAAILASLAALAIVASPFILVGWLVWRAVRRRPPAIATTTTAA